MTSTSQFTEDDFDELLDRFEDEWKFGEAGGPSVQRFLVNYAGELPADLGARQRLISELVQIDIDRWWMNWAKHVENALSLVESKGNRTDVPQIKDIVQQGRAKSNAGEQSHDRSANESLTLRKTLAKQLFGEFSHRATLKHYLDVLSQRAGSTGIWHALVQCEVDARDRWGDQIGFLYFDDRIEWRSPQSSLPVRSYAKTTILARCDHDASENVNSNPRFPVRGRSVFGRQRFGDAPGSPFGEFPKGNRIVLAARNELTISREQMALQLLTPNIGILTNLSHINSIEVTPSAILESRESIVVRFPITVRLPAGRSVFLYSSDR